MENSPKNQWPYLKIPSPEPLKKYNWPKISVITPSYNQGLFIEETILSVINQDYPNLEYIIVDGGSHDNTVEIIQKYQGKLKFWVSEKDNGQAHAINKGLEKATGDIFCYLNSDDCFYEGALKEIAVHYLSNISTANKLLFVGQCYWAANFYDRNGWLDVPAFPTSLKEALIKRGLGPQPSMFWTNTSLRFYDKLNFCLDFEFWLQLLIDNYKVIHIPRTLSLFRLHSASKTNNLTSLCNLELNAISSIYTKYLPKDDIFPIRNYILSHEQNALKSLYINQSSKKNFRDIISLKLPLYMKIKIFVNLFIKKS